jgi:hypothetical protein
MKLFRSLFVPGACLLAFPARQAQGAKLTTAQGRYHFGDRATVCAKVLSTHCARNSRGEATLLNLDEPYPHSVFTILIGRSHRVKFGACAASAAPSRIPSALRFQWGTAS